MENFELQEKLAALTQENKEMKEHYDSACRNLNDFLDDVVDKVRNTFKEETGRKEEKYVAITEAAKQVREDALIKIEEANNFISDMKGNVISALEKLEKELNGSREQLLNFLNEEKDFRTLDEVVRDEIKARGNAVMNGMSDDASFFSGNAILSDALNARESMLSKREEELNRREEELAAREDAVFARENAVSEREEELNNKAPEQTEEKFSFDTLEEEAQEEEVIEKQPLEEKEEEVVIEEPKDERKRFNFFYNN
jgi:hypothetical protein